MTDWGEVGVIAAELIETLVKDYEDEDVEIGTVAIIVEITGKEEDPEERWTTVTYRCNDARRWIQAGLFDAASEAVRSTSEERP